MFYEKKLESLRAVLKELGRLDSDAGIRILGIYEGRECFVFVSRSMGGFEVMLYSRKGKSPQFPRRRILAQGFSDLRALEGFLRDSVEAKFPAFAY